MYWQDGHGDQRRYRLELRIPVAGGVTTGFEQICTGSELWLHADLGTQATLEVVDLKRVRTALARLPKPASRSWWPRCCRWGACPG